MTEITLTIPLVPPSVNRYVRHTRAGKHYVTREAKAFKEAIAIFARGASITAKAYELTAEVHLAKAQRGDGDNLWKCIADGLVEARVIHSDAAVTDWILRKRRDPAMPRTVITVRAL